jgi:dGTPase
MDVCDDIAYSTYDLEDSFKAGFLSPIDMMRIFSDDESVRSEIIAETNRALKKEGYEKTNFNEAANAYVDLANLSDAFASLDQAKDHSGAPTALAYMQMSRAVAQQPDLRTAFTSKLVGRFVDSVDIDINEKNPSLSYVRLPRARRLEVELLKHLTFSSIIRSHRLRIVADRGREIVKTIFEAFERNPALLPDDWYEQYQASKGKQRKMRCICDFVACLTDRDAVDVYARLRSEEHTTIFKPLG